MLEPIHSGSLRTRLTAWLFDAILRGDLAPGERIVEGKLARQLEVAQTTLREALQELEHQGLVTKSERRGNFVTRLTPKDMEDIYVVRLALEPVAAALAQPRMTAEDHRQLAHILDEMRRASERQEYLQVLKLDMSFHQLIWRLSGNRSVEKALNVVCPPLFANYLIRISSGDLYDFEKDHEEHVALLATLKKGGPDEVREAFRAMVEIFHVQDVDYLVASEGKRASASPSRPRKVLHTL